MDADEGSLSGGMVNEVVRVGDTVRRTAGPWSPTVHGLLTHLHEHGFRYSPIPLGFDGQDREVLTYLDGLAGTRPWSAAVRSNDGMSQMAAMIAELHAALTTFPEHDDDIWRTGGAPGAGPRTIRHGDVGPWNMLWDGDQLVGLIDWDFAEPAPALWDFAQLAWYAVPLDPEPEAWVGYGFTTEPDYRIRLDIICDASGCTRADLVDALHAHLACERDRILTWGPEGTHPFDSFLDRGFVTEIDAMTAWLHKQLF